MAFRYIDGQVYESNFHFWYLNGVQPDPALKMEIEDRELRRPEPEERIDTRFIYADDGKEYGDVWEFRYVNGHNPEADKMRPVEGGRKSKEVLG